ncbi:hypothetical protein I6F07_10965 [Ensifer sp. IC4062]|nr:hypothetical protein [Ensifer sp. IC4062]MCA1440732.1 hypothetical protein [Ensifer sp. IC4062]
MSRRRPAPRTCPADAASLIGMVDGEAAEDGEPGRAYAPEPARRFRLLYRTGSECIIADDAVASPTTKVRDAPPALLGAGAATQPVIQFRDAGVEFGQS